MPTRAELELFRRMARAAGVADDAMDAGTYLSRLRRPLPAPKAPDMSLDSPLFRQMYAADRANDQLLKGRTANLRNAGGDFARIAGQYADAQNQAARAARDMPFLDRALTLEDGGPMSFFVPTAAAGLTAGGLGVALNSAMEDRRLREMEADDANRLARSRVATDREIRAAQAALLPDGLEQMEADFDPVATQVFSLPDDSFDYTDEAPDVSPEIAQEMDDLHNEDYMRRVRTPHLPVSALQSVYDKPTLPETMDFEAPQQDVVPYPTSMSPEQGLAALTQSMAGDLGPDLGPSSDAERASDVAEYWRTNPEVLSRSSRPLGPAYTPPPSAPPKPRRLARPLRPANTEGTWYTK